MRRGLLWMVVLLACSERSSRAPTPFDAEDFDRDGHRAVLAGGDDCDDRDPSVRPDAVETCDGRDEDCDGAVDEGFECVAGTERPCGRLPGFVERCDESCSWGPCTASSVPPECGDAPGECAFGEEVPCDAGCGTGGVRRCGAGCVLGPCEPPAERCNGIDDDCDGDVDEGTLGVAGPLFDLPWTGPARTVAATMFDDLVAVASSLRSDSAIPAPVPSPPYLTFLDPDGTPVGEPIELDDDPEAQALKVEVVAADGELAVLWEQAFGWLRMGWVSPDGVRASGQASFWVCQDSIGAVWTGDEVVATEGCHIWSFDLDGNATREELRRETRRPPPGRTTAVWTDDGLATVSADGFVVWSSLDGATVREVSLGFESERAVIAADGDGLRVAWATEGSISLARLDAAGGEIWREEEPAPEDFVPFDVLSWAGAVLVLAEPIRPHWPGLQAGGWLVDADGGTLDPPRLWIYSMEGGGGLVAYAVAGEGEDVFFFIADEGVLGARIGCAAP